MSFMKHDADTVNIFRLKCKRISTSNFHISWPIFAKLGIEVIYLMPFSKHEFCENGCRDSHTQKAYMKFCIIAYIFRSIWISFGTELVHKHSLHHCHLRQTDGVKSPASFISVNKFLFVLSTFIFRLGEIQHRRSAHKALKHYWVSQKQAQGGSQFYYECK